MDEVEWPPRTGHPWYRERKRIRVFDDSRSARRLGPLFLPRKRDIHDAWAIASRSLHPFICRRFRVARLLYVAACTRRMTARHLSVETGQKATPCWAKLR